MKRLNLTFWKMVAGVIFVLALYATYIRFAKGLGAATDLSDEFPWGLWVGFDVLVGVGLAAGGFVIAATVHIFNLEKYEPIARPAILTAFLGYLLVVLALMFDLGRPYRIWHPLVMWNPHSVMFEVGWCVTLYTIVLAMEFSPIVLERFNLKVPLKFIRTIYLPLVIVGVLLSMLHQSSLGTFYVIVPDKLHGLWYSSLLPVFFFITAIAAGLGMTILESFLSYRAFGKRLEKEQLMGLARVIVVVLAVYFVFKFQQLYLHGNLHLAFEPSRESVLFWGEMGLGVVLPMLLLSSERMRRRDTGLFFGALLVVMGFIMSRLNVAITGMLHNETYFPKWTEIIVTIALVALGFVAFSLAVKHLNVFPKEELTTAVPADRRQPIFTRNIALAVWALVIIGMVTYGMTAKYEENHQGESNHVQAAARSVVLDTDNLDLPPDFTYPLGEDSPGEVTFSHENHIGVQEEPDCVICHFGLFDITRDGETDTESVTMEAMYEGSSCGKCHNGDVSFATDECEVCHVE